MPSTITLQMNVPQQLALSETAGELDGNQVHYQTTCGRILSLSYVTAIRLNGLDLKPGEQFVITKLLKDRMIFHDIRLAGASERVRAAEEAPELEQQLAESIRRVRQAKPAAAPSAPKAAPEIVPMPAAKSPLRPTPPAVGRVSYRDALRDITTVVTGVLKEQGEQWNDAAKQDLVSTVFIAAGKTGQIVFDFMVEGGKDAAA